jgi:hypothetical protein
LRNTEAGPVGGREDRAAARAAARRSGSADPVVELPRRRWLFGVALMSAVASLGVTIAARSAADKPRAAPQIVEASTAAKPPALVKGIMGFGVAYGDTLTWKSDKDLGQGLDDAVALGATWVRVDLSWNDIQPASPDGYIWHRFDRIAAAAAGRRLNVLATIAYTPAWARRSGCTAGAKCAPADPARFAAFALLAAERYAPMGVHTWEVWNEPNIGFWAPRPDPAGYTALLDDTAAALRRGDSRAFVVMAGLAAGSSNRAKGTLSAADFLTSVSELGADRVVDAVAYHPYNGQYLPSARTSVATPYERLSRTGDSLVSVLRRFGVPDLPIWITETGVLTNAPGAAADGSTFVPDATHVTEDMQARIAGDAVATLGADPHVATMFWYSDQDSAIPLDYRDLGAFFGLRRYDGSKKPAFAALTQAIAAYDEAHR